MRGLEAHLNFGMIRGNTKSYEPKGHGQRLVHINFCIMNLRYNPVGRIEAGWAGANNGHPERASICDDLAMGPPLLRKATTQPCPSATYMAY